MSLPPALATGPPPKSTVFWKDPTTNTLPLLSVATARGMSVLIPPKVRDHRYVPLDEYLATKTSRSPALTTGPPPKSAVLSKYPVTTTFPLPSTATPMAISLDPPPRRLDHRCAPLGEYFATKTSAPPPLADNGPPPKSTVPTKYPVTSTLPPPSTATP